MLKRRGSQQEPLFFMLYYLVNIIQNAVQRYQYDIILIILSHVEFLGAFYEHMFIGQRTYVPSVMNICSWTDEHMLAILIKKLCFVRQRHENWKFESKLGCRPVFEKFLLPRVVTFPNCS